jgi:hypothetical protein
MKVILILVLMVHICFAVCFREWFSSTTFPPAGWTIDNLGPGEHSWNRSESGQPGNGYAFGHIHVTGTATTSTTILKTFPFSLYAGEDCHVDFLWSGTISDPDDVSFSWSVVLYNSTNVVATTSLGYPPISWQNKSINFENIASASSNYMIGWKLSGSCYPYAYGASAYFDVDSVHIYDESVSIEPTSLGRIKGAFH